MTETLKTIKLRCPVCWKHHQKRDAAYRCALSPLGRHIPAGMVNAYLDSVPRH